MFRRSVLPRYQKWQGQASVETDLAYDLNPFCTDSVYTRDQCVLVQPLRRTAQAGWGGRIQQTREGGDFYGEKAIQAPKAQGGQAQGGQAQGQKVAVALLQINPVSSLTARRAPFGQT